MRFWRGLAMLVVLGLAAGGCSSGTSAELATTRDSDAELVPLTNPPTVRGSAQVEDPPPEEHSASSTTTQTESTPSEVSPASLLPEESDLPGWSAGDTQVPNVSPDEARNGNCVAFLAFDNLTRWLQVERTFTKDGGDSSTSQDEVYVAVGFGPDAASVSQATLETSTAGSDPCVIDGLREANVTSTNETSRIDVGDADIAVKVSFFESDQAVRTMFVVAVGEAVIMTTGRDAEAALQLAQAAVERAT